MRLTAMIMIAMHVNDISASATFLQNVHIVSKLVTLSRSRSGLASSVSPTNPCPLAVRLVGLAAVSFRSLLSSLVHCIYMTPRHSTAHVTGGHGPGREGEGAATAAALDSGDSTDE